MSILVPCVALCVVSLCLNVFKQMGDIKRCTLYGVYLLASDMFTSVIDIGYNMSEARKYTEYRVQRFWSTKTKQRGNTIFWCATLGGERVKMV